MSQTQDASVIRAALAAHAQFLSAAESAHRHAAEASPAETAENSSARIVKAAAHRARSSSFGQRREFVDQLLNFPVSGLGALTAHDMRALQVPAHIGASCLPEGLATHMDSRQTELRSSAARAEARPAGAITRAEDPQWRGSAAFPPPPQPEELTDRLRPSFDHVVYGRVADHRSHAEGNRE